MTSIFKNYEKVEYVTRYTGYFFLAIAAIFLVQQPNPSMTGFLISLSAGAGALIVAIYNDVRHEKYSKLKERALGGLGVILITAVYFLLG